LKFMTTPLDTPWKQILESYFPQFMAFFFPEAYRQIDWSRGFDFLDGELQKLNIMKMMYDRGYSRQEVTDLYRFVDWVLTLPPDLAKSFKTDLITYEGEKNMSYISELERESLAAGEAKGEAKVVILLLNHRVGRVSEETAIEIRKLPIDRLEKLATDLLDFTGSNDLAEWLQRYGLS
jgi:hypothetical protein